MSENKQPNINEEAVIESAEEEQDSVEETAEQTETEPVAETEAIVESVSEAETTEEPVAEAEDVEEPVAETEGTEEPVAETEATEESVSEAEVVEEPVAETEVTEESVSKAEATEKPVTETEAVEEPEETTSEEPVVASSEASVEDVAADVEPSTESSTDESAASDEDSDEDDEKKVVRMLAVGQQVNGVVKRITDFGAFVDIGVGRDGLIHVSELSINRVGKVSDVLSESQEIQPWIKKLDRERNRISLTLIDPEMKTIRDLKQDEVVSGTVTRILPYGAFVDIGIGRDALLHVREMSNKFVEKPEDVVSVGEELEARIVELSRRRGRVDLSLKGLRDEPEDEIAVEVMDEDGEYEELEDEFENVEVLSPMELAFKKAVEAEGGEVKAPKRSNRKSKGGKTQSIQDEIIARTLDTSRK